MQSALSNGLITTGFGIILAGLLLALSWVDLREFRLPNALNFTLILAGLCWSYLAGNIQAAAIGAAAGYSVFVAIAWAFKRARGIDGLGRGDAKLLAGGGAWCGWMGLPMIVLIASVLGIAFALLSSLRQTPQMQKSVPANWIPFGPCLAVGIFAVWASAQLSAAFAL